MGWVCGECVGRAWGVHVCAISVGIARSALLSGYLGKSGHLPRCKIEYSSSCMYQITLEFLSMFVFYENKLVLNEMFSHIFRPQCSSKKRD